MKIFIAEVYNYTSFWEIYEQSFRIIVKNNTMQTPDAAVVFHVINQPL